MTSETLSQASADIKARIEQLSALDSEDLKPAMGELKKALMENPDACAILLPQDIGEMVKALMRITGQAIEEQVKAKSKARTKKDEKAILAQPLGDDF